MIAERGRREPAPAELASCSWAAGPGDLLGRQRLFVAGLILFAAASLVYGLAQNPETLIVGRAVQGLGGALASPTAATVRR